MVGDDRLMIARWGVCGVVFRDGRVLMLLVLSRLLVGGSGLLLSSLSTTSLRFRPITSYESVPVIATSTSRESFLSMMVFAMPLALETFVKVLSPPRVEGAFFVAEIFCLLIAAGMLMGGQKNLRLPERRGAMWLCLVWKLQLAKRLSK